MSMSRGALGDALFEDARAFVDQREHAALDDLVVADLARRDAALLADTASMSSSTTGSGIGVALPGFVAVPAGAGLLAEAAQLAEPVGHLR